MVLWFGFPLLLWLGSLYWRVDLAGYLRSGQELIAGYSEAMTVKSGRTSLWAELNCPFQKPLGVELSWPYLLAIGLVVWWGRGRLVWRAQLLLFLPLSCGLLLLFKNAFVRADGMHLFYFYQGLPLLLAVWCLAWRQYAPLRLLFLFSLCYPLALLSARAQWNWSTGAESLPLRYAAEVIRYPWSGGADYLQSRLNARYPSARLPADIRATIGQATMDVMPWEVSLAIANGLNYQPRPIPQSYSAYTPWLDGLNAHHLAANNAPDYILFSGAQPAAIDDRPAAWDEAQTKRVLLENYSYQTKFPLPQKVGQAVQLKSANTFLLRHTPRVRRLVPVSTNAVVLQLNQTLSIPTTTNLIFLTLQVDRSVLGKLQSAAFAPALLAVCFQYEDGTSKICRAILPILQTGVLVNRRVESEEDIGNWLKAAAFKNPAITAISFSSAQPWAIQSPLTGQLVEYRLQESEVEK